METWSLVLTIIGVLLSIAGIIVSIYCWKNNYKEIKALKELNTINFNEEHCFENFSRSVLNLLKVNPDVKNPYDLKSKNRVESMKACLFNMIQRQNGYMSKGD